MALACQNASTTSHHCPERTLNTKIATFLAAASLATAALAQAPYLVKDINTTVAQGLASSNPSSFQVFGDAVYFKASTQQTGVELYKYSNGTAQLVRDITPYYYYDSTPSQLYDVGGGRLVFDANDVTHGRELWVTDGTSAGTVLLKDINPAGNGVLDGGRTVYNGRFYFMAYDATHGAEPWVSDGTADGTQLFADLNSGTGSSNCTGMAVLGGNLILFVDGALWTSDGTAAGTSQVTSVGSVTTFMVAGPRLYFVASSAASGSELWVTDGTAGGTQMLADIAPGSWSGLSPNARMVAIGDTIYFAAASDAIGFDLWKTDGTTAGTQFVTSLSGTSNPVPGPFIAAGPLFCFSIGEELWRSDGTAGGTFLLDAVTAYGPSSAFGKVFYRRTLSNGIDMLMSTDGNTTTVVRSDFDFQPAGFTEAGGKLYFSAFDSLGGIEPWVSDDGTGATTRRLANIAADAAPSSNPHHLTAVGDKLFFSATQTRSTELWKSDGTAGGTVQLSYFSDGVSNIASLDLFTAWRNNLYFSNSNNSLWRSNGALDGTAALKSLQVSWMFPTEQYLFMSATNNYYPMLYRTDGTDAGTIPLVTGSNNSDGPMSPSGPTEFGGRIYVATGYPDYAMWVSAGTVETTKRLFRNATYNYYNNAPLQAAAGGVFYAASDSDHGTELWRTDGRAGGQSMVKDIYPGSQSSGPASLTRGGRFVYFTAFDPVNGYELWRSDGTEAGTILLRDILPGGPYASSNVANLVAGSRLVYFTANDGLHGTELWQTDGTPAGTTLVADLAPGAASSNPQGLRFANGRLWFAADDGSHGIELWSVAEGATPSLVADLAPGIASSSPAEIVQAGNLLYFTANTDVGNELWALPLSAAALFISDTRVSEGNGSGAVAHFTVTRSGPADQTVTVSYATSDMVATAGSDYVAQSGELTFQPGETSKTIDISILADTIAEPDETFVVTLSSPVNAVLDRAVGLADIEDDDHRVALSISPLPNVDYYAAKRFHITNGGPSVASDLRLTYSESPYLYSFSVNGQWFGANPASIMLDPLAPGASMDVTIQTNQIGGYVDPANPPGHTVTASVSAAEPESDLTDNTTSSIRGANGRLVLPPWLVAGTTATATYNVPSTSSPVSATLTSSDPNVVISPATVTIPAGQTSAAFTLTVGNGTGRVRLSLSGNDNDAFIVPVVGPGVTPKLDVAIAVGNTSLSYFQPVTIPVQVAARRHDGTLPTGTLTLRDVDSNTNVAQQALDSTGATTFILTGLPAGQYNYVVDYSGDANFNAFTAAPARIYIHGYVTTIGVQSVPPFICAGTTLSFSGAVYTSLGPSPAPGSLTATIGSASYTVPLTPATSSGVAVFNHTFTASDAVISFFYPGSGAYESTRRDFAVFVQPCQSMGLVAQAVVSGASVQWTAVPGASYYEVFRYTRSSYYTPAQWFNVYRTPATNWIDPGYGPYPAAFLYSIRAVNANGDTIAFSPPDLAVMPSFADDPLTAGTTPIRSTHYTQLAGAAIALQYLAGNSTFSPPPQSVVGLPINAADFANLRTPINAARSLIGLPAFAFTTPPPVSGDTIRAIDIQQLRDAMN